MKADRVTSVNGEYREYLKGRRRRRRFAPTAEYPNGCVYLDMCFSKIDTKMLYLQYYTVQVYINDIGL